MSAVEPEALPEVEPGTEAQTDEPSPEPETAVSWPAASFAARASGVNVTVTADEGAFPEGTTMSVRRVWDNDAISEIRESVADDFVKVRRVQLVDIAFYDAEGNEIEPRIPVSVVISVSEINDDQSAVVVHMDDEGQTQIVADTDVESASGRTNLNVELPAGDTEPGEVEIEQTEVGVGDVETEISFDADGFSLYAVVVTETISTHYIDASGNTYSVEVSYGPEAGIPSGATLAVSELEGDEAEAYIGAALEAVENDGNNDANSKKTTLKYAKALDISILMDGMEVRPVAPISVSIKLLDAPNSDEFDEANVVHFGDEAEVVESNIQQEAVRFETDGFSVYVVTYTLSTFYMDAAGNTFNIEVEYDREAGIPEGAQLAVSELTGDAARAYLARAAEALDVTSGQVVYAKPLDIAIVKDGEEVQIQSPVKVSVKLLDAPEALNNDNLNVLHFGDEVETVDCALNGESIEFEADGFSVYVFAYTSQAITLQGSFRIGEGDAVSLSGILDALKVPKGNDAVYGIDDVEAVTCVEDGHLTVTAVSEPKDWSIISNNAFAEPENLTLTVGENTHIEIAVTCTEKIHLTITADSAEKTYDGTALTKGTYTISEGSLFEGDEIESVTIVGTQTDVGTCDNVPSNAVIKDAAGTDVRNSYDIEYVKGTLKVTAKTVTVKADDQTKVYDNDETTDPSLTATVTGLVGEGNVDYSPDPDNEGVIIASISGQDGKKESVSFSISRAAGEDVTNDGYTITPTGDANQSNYAINCVVGTLTITPKTVIITSGVVGVDKPYDGTTDAALTGENPGIEGLVAGDVITGVTGTGTFDNADVGENKSINVTSLTLQDQNGDNKNYTVDLTSSNLNPTANITDFAVTVTIVGNNSTVPYDGKEHTVNGYTIKATKDDDGKDVTKLFDPDNIIFTPEEGVDYSASRTNVVEDGDTSGKTYMGLAGNLFTVKKSIANFGEVTLSEDVIDGYQEITPKSVRVTANSASKTYGDADPETLTATVTGLVGDDTIEYTVSRAEGETVGNYTIIPSGDATQGNYAVTYVNSRFTINKKSVTVTGITASDKPYDGKKTIPLDCSAAEITEGSIKVGDKVTVESATGTFETADVALEGDTVLAKEVTITRITLGGAQGGNYTVDVAASQPETPLTAKIMPLPVTVTITGNNNTADYDGEEHTVSGYTAKASSTLYKLSDHEIIFTPAEDAVLEGDEIVAKRTDVGTTAMGLATDQFSVEEDANFTVTFKVDDGYQTITPLPVAVTINGNSNTTTYDGQEHVISGYTATADSTLYNTGSDFEFTPADGADLEGGVIAARRTQKGTTYMGLAKDQFDNTNANFNVTFDVTDGYQTISPETVIVSGIKAKNKVFDGTVDATLDCNDATLSGKKDDDDLSVEAKGVFADKNIGEGKTVTISGLTLKGAAADNYVLAEGGQQTETTADITRKSVLVKADNKEKIYDNDPNEPALTATVTGLVGTDTVDYTLTREAGEDVRETGYVITAGCDADKYEHNEAQETGITHYLQGNYDVVFESGILTINLKPVTITANDYEKVYDGLPLSDDGNMGYTYTELVVGDAIKSITITGSQTLAGNGDNEASDVKIIRNEVETDDVTENYAITYVKGVLKVTARPLTITAGSAAKVYDGEALEEDSYTVGGDGLAENDSIESVAYTSFNDAGGVTEARDIGEYKNRPSDALIRNGNGDDVTGSYGIVYEDGILTINPAQVTLTANSGIRVFDAGNTQSVSGFTTNLDALTSDDFSSVSASGSGAGDADEVKTYPVVFDGVIINETKDDSGRYTVTKAVPGTLTVTPGLPIEKAMTKFGGNLAEYEIKFNPHGYQLNNGAELTLKDTFSVIPEEGYSSQSIIYSTISVPSNVSYDFSEQTGTYTIPDGTPVTITYTTRVSGSAGDSVKFADTARLGRMLNGKFEELYAVSGEYGTDEDNPIVITPTGTDAKGEDGKYTLQLYTYAEDSMQTPLEGAVYRLLDSNQRPMTYKTGSHAGEEVTFGGNEIIQLYETDDSGSVVQSIRKNTLYYLEMLKAPDPVEKADGSYTYFQKDTTLYNFLISDNPSYSAGKDSYGNRIYTFYNGDILKVKCYSSEAGVKVKVRFSGNYTYPDAGNIRLVLQEKYYAGNGWDWRDVESHLYSENRWGVVSFTSSLTPASNYQVILRDADPEAGIEHNVGWSVASYNMDGTTSEDTGNGFTYDPENTYSYNILCDNEYLRHTLTLVLLNEKTGERLEGATFNVNKLTGGSEEPVASPVTSAEGLVTIQYDDSQGGRYDTNTLYYVQQTGQPDGYLLPDNPEKIYFYFSADSADGEDRWTPGGDVSAIDLSTTYESITLYNATEKVDIPFFVTWNNGDDDTAWPEGVDHVNVRLYRTANGETERLEGIKPLRKAGFYDTFSGLDARVVIEGTTYPADYFVKVEAVYSSDTETEDSNITADYYIDNDAVSGTGWHVLKIQPATRVTVNKEWYKLGGTERDDAEHDPVTFELYRTTQEYKSAEQPIDRDDMEGFLDANSAEKVELEGTERTLSHAEWSSTVVDLPSFDDAGSAYFYFVLEDEDSMPVNHEDKYDLVAATEDAPRTLTIRNIQTLTKVTIKANNTEKYYGQDDKYDFSVSVADPSITEADIIVGEPVYNQETGKYDVAVTVVDKTINFTVSRENGETVKDGGYQIILEGDSEQQNYRVVLDDENSRLTIKPAEIVVTPLQNATKTYGENDPADNRLVKLTYKNEDPSVPFDNDDNIIVYDITRDYGENVEGSPYRFTVTGDAIQGEGNYYVEFANGGIGYLTITPKKVTVKAKDQSKTYGNDDPVLELDPDVLDLAPGDSPSVISYTITREEGESVKEGGYTITARCGEGTFAHYDEGGKTWFRQGNYDVTFENGTLTINPRKVTVKAINMTKTYGDLDPDFVIDRSVLDLAEGDDESAVSYSLTRLEADHGEDVKEGGYTITARCGDGTFDHYEDEDGKTWYRQGNYDVTYENGTLTIKPAVLTIAVNDQTKALGDENEPLLDADNGTGWKFGEEASLEKTSSINEDASVNWTYTYTGQSEQRQVVFTVSRESGKEAGMYDITATCQGDSYSQQGKTYYHQGNYDVTFTKGTLTILALYDVNVIQQTRDDVVSTANPPYAYTAKLEGDFEHYTGNGFDNGVMAPFTLPDNSALEPNKKTLKVPAGAKLTVTQIGLDETADPNGRYHALDYTTERYNGDQVQPAASSDAIVIENVTEYSYDLKFVHKRRSLPVEARWTEDDTSEETFTQLDPAGAVGIAYGEDGEPTAQAIDVTFAAAMEDQILYTVPENKYSPFDHASLYKDDGTSIQNVTAVNFDKTELKWQYKTENVTDFEDIEDATLVLFYMPKYVCQVSWEGLAEPIKCYTLNEAMGHINGRTKPRSQRPKRLPGRRARRARLKKTFRRPSTPPRFRRG